MMANDDLDERMREAQKQVLEYFMRDPASELVGAALYPEASEKRIGPKLPNRPTEPAYFTELHWAWVDKIHAVFVDWCAHVGIEPPPDDMKLVSALTAAAAWFQHVEEQLMAMKPPKDELS